MWWERIGVLAVTSLVLNACRAPHAIEGMADGWSGCPSDLRVLYGACVPLAIADATCGVDRTSTLAGCVPKPACDPGRPRDLSSGACLAHREARALASSVGVLVDEETILDCDHGGLLASGVSDARSGESPLLGCLPPRASEDAKCPAGAVPLAGACAPITSKNGQIVDVATWARAVLGADGGAGAPPLCNALQYSPGALAVAAPMSSTLNIELAFPDNDVSQVIATVSGDADAGLELDHAVAPLVEALRRVGGKALAASLTAKVTCRRSSERPHATTPR